MLLKNVRYLVTQNAQREILENVDVHIVGNTIAAIAEHLQVHDSHVIDCSQRIVLPGLINCHTHLGMTMLRGISDDKELGPWLDDIFAAEGKMTPKDIEAGTYLGIVEALRTGTTTVLDMYYCLELAAAAAQKLGIRYVGAVTFLEGHPLSSETAVLPQSPSSRITYCYGPHAIYSTSEPLLKDLRAAASRDKALLHIHLSETRKERAEFRARTGMLPVEYLERIGFLGPDVMVAHCTWLTKGELDILSRHGVKIVHCPQSNMKLAGGSVMPLREMQERELVVALGTDSAASNNSLDMFREMHVGALLHKHHYWDGTAASAQTMLDLATLNGARALGRHDLGSVEEHKLADIITLDLADVNLQPHDAARIISHLVYAANGLNVSEVIADGVLLLSNKQFVPREDA